MSDFILGINIFGHDASVALLDGETGHVLYSLTEERFSNQKHDGRFPVACVREINRIVQSENRGKITHVGINFVHEYYLTRAPLSAIQYEVQDEKILAEIQKAILDCFPYTSIFEHGVFPMTYFSELLDRYSLSKGTKEKILARILWYGNLGVLRRSIFKYTKDIFPNAEVIEVPHHDCHAASAFFASGFQDAAVLTLDGRGEWDASTLQRGRNGKLTPISVSPGPGSIGLLYLDFTYFLGFGGYGEEFKVMGMAAYGKPVYIDHFRKLASVDEKGVISWNCSDLLELADESSCPGHLMYKISPKFSEILGGPRKREEELGQRHYDIAASLQKLVEEIGVQVASRLKTFCPDTDYLAIGGGVGLNGLMNMEIYKKAGFKHIFVQPAAGDDGGAMGAAYFIFGNLLGRQVKQGIKHSFFGIPYSQEEVHQAMQAARVKFSTPPSIHKKIAEILAEGNIVSRFSGRSENGPRALGHRSILSAAFPKEMKDILNARIKHREMFRPFAPACLEEYASEYFEIDCKTEYMLLICRVKESKMEKIPAVVHADGTARLQTISKEHNPDFHKILSHYYQITGIPVLVNTSFNVNGESIVETPLDAIECFLYTDIDYLAIEDHIIAKSENEDRKFNISSQTFLARRKQRYKDKYFEPMMYLSAAENIGMSTFKAEKYDEIHKDWIAKEQVIQSLARELEILKKNAPMEQPTGRRWKFPWSKASGHLHS